MERRTEAGGALRGLRIIELGNAIAAPFAAALLGDMGADVIKVEPTEGGGDSLRTAGPSEGDVGLWWSVAGRNKRCITLNLKTVEGVSILRKLAATADVLIENYRPGVMDRLGLGWEVLHQDNPNLVMLSISGYGHTGPKRHDRGFGKVAAEAFSGATNLTGHKDRPAVHPSYSVGDSMCGIMAAYSVMVALHARNENSAGGQWIDLALYEPMFRILEWQLPVHHNAHIDVTRNGPMLPFESDEMIVNIFETQSGGNVVVVAATPPTMANLHEFVRARDADYRQSGVESTRELTAALMRWCAGTPTDEVVQEMTQSQIIAGLVLSPADIMSDEHYAARGSIRWVDVPRVGPVPMPDVIPRLSETPGEIRWSGPDRGEHNEDVLTNVLGLTAERIGELRMDGVI